MVRLSVNVNKVATLRNSRGGAVPSVLDAVRVCVDAGVPGITVHPRADARHITSTDVIEVAALLRPLGVRVEFNIEGDPRRDLIALVREVKPTQCTLVPVRPGELTSQAGWSPETPRRTDGQRRQIAARRRRSRQPVRGSGRGCDSLGGRGGGRPGGALHGAVRPRLRTRPEGSGGVVRGVRPRCDIGKLVSASASTRGTTWTSIICKCSGVCRISTRCQSATP